MAVNTGTLQTIDLLNNLIKGRQADRTREEDRSMQLLRLRVQTDQAELDRTSQRLNMIQQEVFKLDKDYAKISGAARSIDRMSNDSGIVTDASSILGGAALKTVKNKQSMLKQYKGLSDRRDSMLESISDYYTGYNQALDQYETARDLIPGKTLRDQVAVSKDEFSKLIESMGGDVSPERQAGMKAKFQELMGPAYDQLNDERNFNQRERLARMRRQAASSGEGFDLRKDVISRYQQLKSKLENNNKKHEISKGQYHMPDINQSATNFSEGMAALAGNLVEMIDAHRNDWVGPDIPAKVATLVDEYKRMKSEGKGEEALSAANKAVRQLRETGPKDVFGKLDFGYIIDKDPNKLEYMNDLLRGYNMLEEYQVAVDRQRLMNDPAAMAKFLEEQIAIRQEQEKSESNENDINTYSASQKINAAIKKLGLEQNTRTVLTGGRPMPPSPALAKVEQLKSEARNYLANKVLAGGNTKTDDKLKKILKQIAKLQNQ